MLIDGRGAHPETNTQFCRRRLAVIFLVSALGIAAIARRATPLTADTVEQPSSESLAVPSL